MIHDEQELLAAAPPPEVPDERGAPRTAAVDRGKLLTRNTFEARSIEDDEESVLAAGSTQDSLVVVAGRCERRVERLPPGCVSHFREAPDIGRRHALQITSEENGVSTAGLHVEARNGEILRER